MSFYTARLAVNGIDLSGYCLDSRGVIIRHGRTNSTEQPNPNSAVFELADLGEAGNEILWVGSAVILDLSITGGAWARHFTGAISDIDASLAPDGKTLHRIVATSTGLGAMANRRIGDEPWPTDMDGERMGRILELSGVPVGTVDPGTVRVRARDIDSQDALRLAVELAGHCFGVLVDERTGSVSYHDAAHRDIEAGPIQTLSAGELLSEPAARQTLSSIVNSITVTFGSEPQSEIKAEDTDSIERYGLYQKRLTTQLASGSDASHVADTLLALYSQPRWGSEIITIPLHTLEPARAAELALLPANVLISVVGSPLPLPPVWAVWVEGIEDHVTSTTFERSLLVSDRYMAPTPEPIPPPEPTECVDFNWGTYCHTDNLAPTGSNSGQDWQATPENGPIWGAQGTEPERAEWLDAATFRITIPAGSITSSFSGLLSLPFGFNLDAAPYDHPDPWLGAGAGNAPDFCIGYDSASTELVGYPADGSPTGEHWRFTLTPDEPRYPATIAYVPSTGFRWDGSYGEAEAFWADGYSPPLGAGRGCNVWHYGDYETVYPGYTRVVTRPGHWAYRVLGGVSDHSGNNPLAMISYVRTLYEIRITLKGFRWSRAYA